MAGGANNDPSIDVNALWDDIKEPLIILGIVAACVAGLVTLCCLACCIGNNCRRSRGSEPSPQDFEPSAADIAFALQVTGRSTMPLLSAGQPSYGTATTPQTALARFASGADAPRLPGT